MRQCSRPAVPHYARVVENLLELARSFLALPRRQIRLTANVGRIETGKICQKRDFPQTPSLKSASKSTHCGTRILPVEHNSAPRSLATTNSAFSVFRRDNEGIRSSSGSSFRRLIARHRIGKRRFCGRAGTQRGQSESRCRGLLSIRRVAKGSFTQSRILQPDRSLFLAVRVNRGRQPTDASVPALGPGVPHMLPCPKQAKGRSSPPACPQTRRCCSALPAASPRRNASA